MPKKKLSLVEIIKANPGATVRVDNDWWGMYRDAVVGDKEYDADEPEYNDQAVELATSREFGGHRYGEGVLDALAEIVGINIEDV